KAAAYSFTPAWLAGVLNLIPSLGVLVLLASLYGIYLLYLGLPVLMKAPEDKALPYTVIVVVCAIVVGVLIGVVAGLFGGMGGAPYGMTGMH
ncbi:MAG: YIP1 family protein, partial [Hydrogenophilaceae bacterium]